MTDQEYVESESLLEDMRFELEDAIDEYDDLEERVCRLETYIMKQRKAIEELENKLAQC